MKLSITNPPAGAQLSKKTPPTILFEDVNVRIVESVGGYPVSIDRVSGDILSTGYLATDANVARIETALRTFLAANHDTICKCKRWGEILQLFIKKNKIPYTHLVPYAPLRKLLVSFTVQTPIEKKIEVQEPTKIQESTKVQEPTKIQESTKVQEPTKEQEQKVQENKEIPKKVQEPKSTISPIASLPLTSTTPPVKKTEVPNVSGVSGASKASGAGTRPSQKRQASEPLQPEKRIKLREVTSYDDLPNVAYSEWLFAIAEAQQHPRAFEEQYKFVHHASHLYKQLIEKF